MSSSPEPPPLLDLNQCAGSDTAERWKAHLEQIYQVFVDEVANGGLSYQGLPIKCRFHPSYDNKHGSFWHLMSEGRDEEERTPDLERCARMRWIAGVADYVSNPAMVRCWENTRSTAHGLKTRTVLWLYSHRYALILERREGFFLLITTYCVRSRQAERFEQEWRAWEIKKTETAPFGTASGTPSTHG